MNIKNRLKKLEIEVMEDLTVCVCYPQGKIEWYKPDLGKDSTSSEQVLMGELIPDVCPDCGKTIEKREIILQLCDNTTKERFSEEWYAESKK